MRSHTGCNFEGPLAWLGAVLAAWLMVAASSAFAQGAGPAPEPSDDAISQPAPQPSHSSAEVLRKNQAELERAESQINEITHLADSGLVPSFRTNPTIRSLEARRTELRALVDRITPLMGDVKARLDKLGPQPKDGAREPAELFSQRKQLTDEVAAFDSLIKRAEVLFVKAGQTLGTINSLRRARFTQQLLARSDDIGKLAFWQQALNDISPTITDAASSTVEGLRTITQSHPFATMGGFLLAVLLGFAGRLFCRRVLQNHSLSDKAQPAQTRAERGARVLRRATFATLPLAVAAGAFLAVMASAGLAEGQSGHVMRMSLIYVVVAAFLSSVLSHALTPQLAGDRLMPIDDIAARRLKVLAILFIWVWLGDQLFALFDRVLATPISLVILRLVVVSLLYAALLIAVAITTSRLGVDPDASRRARAVVRWSTAFFAAAALFILSATLLGWLGLARFTGGQIVATGGLLLLLTLIHLTAEQISARGTREESESGSADATKVGASILTATLGVALGIALDLATLVIGIPLLLLQWGYDWSEVFGWIQSAYFGVSIGSVKFSLETIFVALLILAGGIIATRSVRNMLMRRLEHVFARANGARDSFGAILTYVGIVVSLLLAISYMGISLSSLAIVAGALSVGIGFGLQSIANNFVSGLILLAERPIKVGDWIVLGDQQGRVQKISVRSTEIRTFDHSTLIVPNSDLITGRVINWTYDSYIGRLMVPIGVSYDANPRQVLEILNKIGRDNPLVLAYPEPSATFEGFGDSSLDFMLRVYLRDVGRTLDAKTELLIAIFEAFRERGIEIPFPQRDLHIRSDARRSYSLPSQSPAKAAAE